MWRHFDVPLQLQLREVVEKEGVDILNPCQSWDQDLYPWTDFAMLTIALPLSEEVGTRGFFFMSYSNKGLPSWRRLVRLLPCCSIFESSCCYPFEIIQPSDDLERLDYHYDDVIMGTMATQITSLTSVYSTVYSDADQRKHQSSASLAFVRGIHRGPVNSQHKWPVTRKCFHFVTSSCMAGYLDSSPNNGCHMACPSIIE